MSLINDMLRDLAEREPRSAHTRSGVTVVPQPAHRTSGWLKGLFWVGGGVILLGAGAWTARHFFSTAGTGPQAQPRFTQVTPPPPRPLAPRARGVRGQPPATMRPVAIRLVEPPTRPRADVHPHPQSVASVQVAPRPPQVLRRHAVHQAPAGIRSGASIVMTPTPPETPAQRISRDLAAAARARNRGDWRRAIRDLDTALAINPQLPRARSALVRLELTHGHVHAAHEVLIQGLRLSHTPLAWRETALDWLAHSGDARTAWMLSQHDAPHPVRAHPHYLALEAALAQATGHWQASRRLYGRMVALSPTDAMAWAGLGIALDQLDQTSGALRADRKALALGTLSRPLAGYLNQRIHALDQVISTREPSHHP